MKPMNLDLYRAHVSPYFSKDFLETEKRELLSCLSGQSTYFSPGRASLVAKNNSSLVLLSNTHLPASLYQHLAPRLKLVIHPNSGCENIFEAKAALAKYKVPVVLGNPLRAQAVSEYMLRCLFEWHSSLPVAHEWDTKRAWPRKLLKEKNILIVGHGHIGKILENTLKPLVPHLFIYDPFKGLKEWPQEKLDAILVCAELTESSHHLINQQVLQNISEDGVLINASRGQIINEVELKNFLLQNPRLKVYLDVFEKEPFSSQEWMAFPKVAKTSHIAGVYDSLEKETLIFEKQVLTDFVTLSAEDFGLQYAALFMPLA